MSFIIGRLQKRFTLLFTFVETVTLTLWGYLLLYSWTSGNIFAAATAFLELFIGLEIEHTLAVKTGNLGPNR